MYQLLKPLNNDRGSVIVVALLLLVFLTIIGITATNNSRVESNITRNSQIYKRDFYAADDGWRHAAMWIDAPDVRPDTLDTDGNVRYAADQDGWLDPPFSVANTDSDPTSDAPYWFKVQHIEDRALSGNSGNCFEAHFLATSYGGGNGTQEVEVRLSKAFCFN